MELVESITIITVLGAVLGSVLLVVFRLYPRKTAKKQVEDSLTKTIRANSELTAEYEKRQQALLKSVQAENTKLRKELAGPVGEDEEEGIPPELLEPIAKKFGINPMQIQQLIENPKIKKMLKGNKDLLPLLPTLLGGLGNNNQQSPMGNQQLTGTGV